MDKILLGDRVLIEVTEGETKTAGGLFVSRDGDPSGFISGVVVLVGTGKDTEQGHVDMKVRVGDKVVFQYGKDISVDGKVYQLVIGNDVIMVTERPGSLPVTRDLEF
jgi:chaperonin GroES